MRKDATAEQIRGVSEAIEARGFKAHPIPGAQRTAIGVTGNKGALDAPVFESLPGVLEVIPVSHAYKLVSREVKTEDSIVKVGDVPVGGRELTIVAGPCAVESDGADPHRRPRHQGRRARTSSAAAPSSRARAPTPSRGWARRGLRILAEAREATGLPVVTEALDNEGVDLVERYADAIQIGARNMQNFSLLKRAGRAEEAGHPQARDVGDARGVPDVGGVHPLRRATTT
jgi:3-deoxy-7-phosphoheptulonate synthase